MMFNNSLLTNLQRYLNYPGLSFECQIFIFFPCSNSMNNISLYNRLSVCVQFCYKISRIGPRGLCLTRRPGASRRLAPQHVSVVDQLTCCLYIIGWVSVCSSIIFIWNPYWGFHKVVYMPKLLDGNGAKTLLSNALLHSGCTTPRTCSSLKIHFSAPNHPTDMKLFVYDPNTSKSE